ncbi:hypothetical protein LguiB_023751 [Lonicera macranthoides]
MEKTPHIAVVSTPGMGHLIPLVEFAKRLLFHHNFSLTLIVPTDGPPSKSQLSFLQKLPTGITYVLLPPVNFDDFTSKIITVETRIFLTLSRSIPSIRQVVTSLVSTTHLVTIVIDLFATEVIHIANDFKISPFIFFPSTAMCLSFFFYLPKLDETVSCEFRDLPQPVQIPGCIPLHGRDLVDPVQDRTNQAYKLLLDITKMYKLAEGIMVNSFKELEEEAVKALQEQQPGKPPVYPIGPIIQMGSSREGEDLECLRWLDNQPLASVLFISFGSGGTLSPNQLNELALGLEMSGQRFLWVVRSPNDKAANASFFDAHSHSSDPFDFLPEGFLERTKGHALVVPSWAPQAQILSHGSTGGFLSHCGWNSTLESVVNGIPLIAWPLYAEQKMNAVILTEGLKVALRAKTDENGVVGRVEIAKVVRSLMEGEEGKLVRNKMEDLKASAAKALSEDGSSTKALAELASKWKNKIIK